MKSAVQPWHLTPEEAAAIGAEWLGLRPGRVSAELLYGEYDQNLRLSTEEGARFVLKFMRGASDEVQRLVDLQIAMLRHLAARNLETECPVPIPSRSGGGEASRLLVDRLGDGHITWMLSYVEGELLDGLETYSDDLLESLGRSVAEVDAALLGLQLPEARRDLEWDLVHVGRTRTLVELVEDPARRALLESLHDRIASDVLPSLAMRPRSLIHSDGGNQHNMIVRRTGDAGGDYRVCGLIDFGDAVETQRVCGLGIAAAYATFGRDEVVDAIARVAAGYDSVLPLEPEDLDLVPRLAATRFVLSVSFAAQRAREHPDDEYALVTAEPAWNTLAALESRGFESCAAHIAEFVHERRLGRSR